jgi:hypothetical protein
LIVPLITSIAKSYTRGRGFEVDGEPNAEIAAVITTASARLFGRLWTYADVFQQVETNRWTLTDGHGRYLVAL